MLVKGSTNVWLCSIIFLVNCLRLLWATDSHQLLVYEKSSKTFQLNENALSLIESLSSPVFIISAIGNARIGKSTTLNCIRHLWNEECANFKELFKSGDTVHPETRGTWMTILPWKSQKNASVILLDVEGTNAGDRSVIDNLSIFTGLLSSEIMAFTGRYVENHILEFFYRISKLLDLVTDFNELVSLGLPSLRVVQIGGLKTPGKTQRDHVVEAMTTPFHDDGYDEQRKSIRKYFTREKIKASKLMFLQAENLHILSEFHLHTDSEYGKQMQKLVGELKFVPAKRSLRKNLLDGKSFADLAKKLVKAMNSNFWEDFGNEYKAIERQICNNAAKMYLEELKNKSVSEIEQIKLVRIAQFENKCNFQEEREREKNNIETMLMRKQEIEEAARKQVEAERKRAEEEAKRLDTEERLRREKEKHDREIKAAEVARAAEEQRRKDAEEKRRQEKIDHENKIKALNAQQQAQRRRRRRRRFGW